MTWRSVIRVTLTAPNYLSGYLLVLLSAIHALGINAAENPKADYTEQELGQIWDQAIHILGGNANVVSRWEGVINYGLIADAPEKELQDQLSSVLLDVGKLVNMPVHRSSVLTLQSYLEQLQNTPPHRLSDCKQADCMKLVVVVADHEGMKNIAAAVPLRDVYQSALEDRTAVCFFAPYQRASVILQALIFVRNDLPTDLIDTCLHEEIYQAFGLFNDFDASTYFSFNNLVEAKQITPLDKLLLSTLYEFESGAPAFAVAQRLIEGLQAED